MIACRTSLVITWMIAVTGALCGAERRLLEPERFTLDGKRLGRQPFFREDEPGWYAVETGCRGFGGQGRGYSAAIHEGAVQRSLSAPLDPPLPAGTYQIFFSGAGMIWNDRPTILRVRLGDALADVVWTQGLHRVDWLPPGRIDLESPAKTLIVEARQWGGKGFGQLYEIDSRCILIDQLYLTDDLAERTGPSSAGAHAVHGDRAAPAEAISQPGQGYREVSGRPVPPPAGAPRAFTNCLAACDGRANILPNSSFELGGGDGWSTANMSQNRQVHIFSEADHVREAFHGAYALRLPGKGVQGLQFSRVFDLPAGGTYTFSGYVRAIAPGAKPVRIRLTPIGAGNRFEEDDARLPHPRPILGAEITPTDSWQRFTATGPLEAGLCVLAVNGACLLDAVQLEPGQTATPYAPRATLEGSLTTDWPGHVGYADGPTELTAWVHNAGTADAQAPLTYRIVDVREQVVAEQTVRIPVPAGQTVSQRIPVAPVRRGLFNATYAAGGRPLAEGELIYAVLPPLPTAEPRHALGANMDNDPATFALMRRMGHTWQLYCKIGADRPNRLAPAPGEYRWAPLREALEMPGPFGMQVMPALWPSQVPPHLQDTNLCAWAAYGDGRRDLTRQVRHRSRLPAERRGAIPFPDLAKWRAHCRAIAEALGDRQPWWTVEDETELYFSNREFARIVRAAADGFRDSGKPMKLSISCMTDYIDELIAEWGGEMPLAGFGASSYDYEYWEARKARHLQRQWNVPWFCIGVGSSGGPQFRRTLPFGQPVYDDAVRTAQRMVLLALVQDAKVIGHYTGRLWWRGALAHTDFPLVDYDGTPLPHGFSFSCIPLLLANAEPVEEVHLDALRTLVFVFRQHGRLHAVTWSNATPGHDIHWPAEPRVWRDARLPGGAAGVTVADMYGNPRGDARRADGDLLFDLTEEPVFLFNDALADDAFLAAVRGLAAAPRPVDLRLAFIPDGRGGVDLGVRAANTGTKALAGLKLDASFPPNRMLTRVDWTLPGRHGTLGDLPPGQAVWGRLPTTIRLDADAPVEHAGYTVWVTEPGGREHAMVDTCWLTVAPRLAAAADGFPSSWDGVPAAWMAYTFSWNRFGRHIVQFVEGGEHFKYITRTDARAAIRAGHDADTLFLSIRCDDDDLLRAGGPGASDRLEIHLNPAPGEQAGTVRLTLEPGAGAEVRVSGDGAAGVRARLAVSEGRGGRAPFTVWHVEAAIPLARLGGAGTIDGAAGFDILWHDADHDGDTVATGVWRWAGRSTGLGTLFFRNEAR